MEVPRRYDEDTEAAQRIARHLVVYMKRRGLNQTRLAQDLDVSKPTITRLLSGERGVGLGLAVRICRRLLIDPAELLLHEPRNP